MNRSNDLSVSLWKDKTYEINEVNAYPPYEAAKCRTAFQTKPQTIETDSCIALKSK